MKFGVYITGACGQSKSLYLARNEEKRGRGSSQSVFEQIKKDTSFLIEKQKNMGFSFTMDPMFLFYDLLQPFAEKTPRVKPGPQENWFNNNTFYRRPQIHAPLESLPKGFMNEYLHKDLLSECPSPMAILPSPYTLFSLSEAFGYSNKKEAILDIASIIKDEAQKLVKNGFSRIQFDEPAIVMRQSLDSINEEEIELFQLGIKQVAPIKGASVCLHTYFGNAAPLIPILKKLPVDCIGIDCSETRMEDIAASQFEDLELSLGLINSRTPAMEDPKDLIDKAKEIQKSVKAKRLWITPNTGLEYIGWTFGNEKLAILEKVKRGLENEI